LHAYVINDFKCHDEKSDYMGSKLFNKCLTLNTVALPVRVSRKPEKLPLSLRERPYVHKGQGEGD
jgi:hypothetical protein